MNLVRLPSNNCYLPGQMTENQVFALVYHGTASPDVFSAIGWLRNPKSEVSSNYVISKAGVTYELVNPLVGRRSWANGKVHPNYDKSIKWLVDCVKREINPNWHTISIEHEATSKEMADQARMTDAQFNASIDLSAWLMRQFNLKAGHEQMLAHRQIAADWKPTCPGVIFVPAYAEVLIARNPDLKP